MDLNFILVIIIFAYLVYCFLKTRKKPDISPDAPQKEVVSESGTDYEKYAVAAVIASLMDDKKYIIKSIFAVSDINEKKSAWKVSGRQENMNKRLFLRKK